MQAALALAPLVIEALPTIETGVEHLVTWINSIRQSAQQSGEWTPKLEAQYQAKLDADQKEDAWQPDAPNA